jgi:hypothetical protein
VACSSDEFEPAYFNRDYLPFPPLHLRVALACAQMLIYHERYDFSRRLILLFSRIFEHEAHHFSAKYVQQVRFEFIQASGFVQGVSAAASSLANSNPAGQPSKKRPEKVGDKQGDDDAQKVQKSEEKVADEDKEDDEEEEGEEEGEEGDDDDDDDDDDDNDAFGQDSHSSLGSESELEDYALKQLLQRELDGHCDIEDDFDSQFGASADQYDSKQQRHKKTPRSHHATAQPPKKRDEFAGKPGKRSRRF